MAGSTRKPELTEALRRDLASLPAGDDALVIFNGHGGIDHADTRNNYLKLWDDGRMTVSDLESLLDAAATGSSGPFRHGAVLLGRFRRGWSTTTRKPRAAFAAIAAASCRKPPTASPKAAA